jgi:hypothetical protein
MQQHKDERGRGEAHQEYHQAPTTKIISPDSWLELYRQF